MTSGQIAFDLYRSGGLPAAEQEARSISTSSYEQVPGPIRTRFVERWLRHEEQLGPGLSVLLPCAERLGCRR